MPPICAPQRYNISNCATPGDKRVANVLFKPRRPHTICHVTNFFTIHQNVFPRKRQSVWAVTFQNQTKLVPLWTFLMNTTQSLDANHLICYKKINVSPQPYFKRICIFISIRSTANKAALSSFRRCGTTVANPIGLASFLVIRMWPRM